MIGKIKDRTRRNGTKIATVLVVTMLVLSAAPISAAGAEVTTWEDDFETNETGEVPPGWETENPKAGVETSTGPGDRSLTLETPDNMEAPNRSLTWEDGPFLDMNESFTVEMTLKHERLSGTRSNNHARFGIVDDIEDPDANALILFNQPENKTILSSDERVDAANVNTSDENVIGDSYHNTWINVKLVSDGNGTLELYIWETGGTEPTDPQATENFSGVAGQFVMDNGKDNNYRKSWLDDIYVEGYEAIDEKLEIESSSLLLHNQTKDYKVYWTNSNNETIEVTNDSNLTVTSENTDGITIDQVAATMTGTGDTSFNDRVTIRAEYDHPNSTGAAFKEVTVANVSVENLDVLPPIYRYSATLGDDTIFFLILTILTGIVGTRFSSAFGGLGLMQMVVTIGWLGGWIGTGLAMVSVFLALFIGFNLAVNIDYAIHR